MGFGRKLEEKMTEKGLKQADIVRATGISKTTLSSMISRDSAKVDVDVFIQICKFLECDPVEFSGETSADISSFAKSNQKEQLRKFGERVKSYRKQKGISQEELASVLGYTTANARSSVSKIERGLCDLSAAKIKPLAQALGVSIADLMGWGDEAKLTDDELEILEMYRAFNDEGQEEARKRLDEMSQIGKYKKGGAA